MKYFSFSSKYKLLKKFSSVFTIKTGEIFKADNGKCYKVKGWFSFLYKLYLMLLSSELVLIPLIVLYFFVDNFIETWWVNLLTCFLIYVLIEVIFIAILPLEEVACWEQSLQEKEKKNSNSL